MAKNSKTRSKNLETSGLNVPGNLLGELEAEIMHFMWELETATVQRVVTLISYRRAIAYTTVMTVMGHLVDKGLLNRTSDGKRYNYAVVQTREQFLLRASRERVRRVLNEFGDLAIAGFMGEIRKSNREKLEELRGLLDEAASEDAASK
jgi:predicted transcriptional regulator